MKERLLHFYDGLMNYNPPVKEHPLNMIVKPKTLKETMGFRSYFAIDEDGDIACVFLGLFTLIRYKERVLFFFGVPETLRPVPKELQWY